MGIDVDRDLEFFPAIDKIMAKLKDLEKKIDAVNFNISLLLSRSETKFKVEIPKIDLKNMRPGKIIQTEEKLKKVE